MDREADEKKACSAIRTLGFREAILTSRLVAHVILKHKTITIGQTTGRHS